MDSCFLDVHGSTRSELLLKILLCALPGSVDLEQALRSESNKEVRDVIKFNLAEV